MTRCYLAGTWALPAGAGSTGALMQQAAQRLEGYPAFLDEQVAPAARSPRGIIKARLSKEALPTPKSRRGNAAPEAWSEVLDSVCDRFFQTTLRLERLAGCPRRLILFGGAAASRELAARKGECPALPVVRKPRVESSLCGEAALAAPSCGLALAHASTQGRRTR